jgi:hypothetical protein
MIPADCPYDVDAAVASGKVVTVEEYQKAHPEWDPKAAAEAEKAAAEKAKAYPGYAASEIPLTPEEAEAQAEAKTKADAEAVEPTPAQTVETAKADDAPKATPVQAPAPPSRPTGGQAHR